MTMVLEAPTVKFIIPADEDLYVDNTPISEEDFRRISEYIEKSKADFRRRERMAAQKAPKVVLK
jgi:uncharacterized protein YdaT